MFENIINSEVKIKDVFKNIEDNSFYFSKKVLDAFHEHGVSEACFNETTGYGFNDLGRDTIEKIYATVFGAEDAIVRNQFVSGSHALSVTLFALLRPNDLPLHTFLSSVIYPFPRALSFTQTMWYSFTIS